MLTHTKGPHQHFNAYYHQNPLLIQFVIAEFVHLHHLKIEMTQTTYDCFHSVDRMDASTHLLFSTLNQLLGTTASDHERSTVSRWTKGPLTKLKDYCEQLSRNDGFQNKKSLKLHHFVHQAWLSALRHLESVHSLKQSLNTPFAHNSLLATKRTAQHLNTRLNQVAKQLPKVLESYCQDENVLFFLFRKKEILSHIFGPTFLTKLLKFSAKKRHHLFQLLLHKYQQRGFDHLLPLIQHQFSS